MKKHFTKILALILIISFCFLSCTCEKETEYSLSNPNSNEKTKALYAYLCDGFGDKVLSGQQESTWIEDEHELKYIESSTGKLPAIYGFDYMNDDFDGVNERAEKWSEKGGIVTICWHTGADFTGEWKDSQEDEIADWNKILTEGTPENEAFISAMDKGAKALKKLEEKNITVLWRPFHEFDGNWFWWSKGGAENFVKLWRMMYDRYTNYWELNNLIWILGYSHMNKEQKKWYPGDEYYDIIGVDSYEGTAQPKLFRAVNRVTTTKPLCFHECGENPTAEELQKTSWLYFMTWHTSYLTDTNSPDTLYELYNSENVITLDELDELHAIYNSIQS